VGKGLKTASAKAKGRRLQDFVRDWLRQKGVQYGLVNDDIKSAIMGTSGVDIVLSPAAKRIFKLDVECKNREVLNVVQVFLEHYEAYKFNDSLKILVHSKNRSPKLVTMLWDDFAQLYENTVYMMQKLEKELEDKARKAQESLDSAAKWAAFTGGSVEATN